MGFMRNKNTKIISLAVLIGVLCITVGYAAFTSVLTIQSGATVKPDASTFNVDFSTSSNSVVAGSVTGKGTNGATAASATINNAGDPTISNLKANFTAPGQVVTYEFYAYNAGQYVAYLTDVIFQSVTAATSNKVCSPGIGATSSLVAAACNGISVKVEVGGLTASATTEVSNHSLAIKTAEKVTVTITYATGSAVADGPFTVNFGDITLTYSSLDESTGGIIPSTPSAGVFTLSRDFDNSGTVSTGDTVTINGESFAVLPSVTRASEISLIAQQNITIADSPRQSASAGTIEFADTQYWANYNESISTYELIEGYTDGGTVYNENSNLYVYIEAYEDYLEILGLTGVSVTIPKPSDIYSDLSNNCLIDGVSWVGYGDPCTPALSSGILEPNDYGFWLDYLLSGYGDPHILKVEKIYSNGDIGIVDLNNLPGNAHLAGIRPVITIPSSLLGL